VTTRDRLTWVALALGPSAWFGGLVAKYALTPPAHAVGRSMTSLRAAFLIALGVGIAGAAIAIAAFVRAPKVDEEGPGNRAARRDRFLAAAAVGLSLAMVLVLAADAIPILVLPAGYEP